MMLIQFTCFKSLRPYQFIHHTLLCLSLLCLVATARIRTHATTSTISTSAISVFDVTFDHDDHVLFVSYGNDAVYRMLADGIPQLLAGSGDATNGTTDGAGSSARFNLPLGITCDTTSNIAYISDTFNYRIRSLVLSSNIVATLAGSTGGHQDGFGTGAKFSTTRGIVCHSSSVLYVLDNYAGSNYIRRIAIASANVSTLATSSSASIVYLYFLCININGTRLYVTGRVNEVMMVDTSNGMIVSLAGGNSTSDFADGVGFNARFDRPQGITLNWNESALIIADCYNQRIRHMEIASRNVTTLAGNGSVGIVDGPGLAATFEYPYGAKWHCVASSNRCGVLVADSANNAIRFDWPKLTATFSKDTTSGSVTEETTSPTQSTTRSASVTSSLTYTTSTTKNVSLSGSLPAGRTASPSTSATRTDDSRSHTPAFHCALLLSDGATSAGTLEQFNANAPEEVVALAPANGTLLAAPVSRSAVLRNPPLAVNLSFFLGGTIRRGLQDAWRPTRVMLNVLPADASFPLLTAAVPFTTESIVTLYRNETLVLLLYPPNSKSPPRWLPSSLSTFRDVTLVLQLTIRCPTDESATSDVIGGAVPRAGALESEVKSLSIVAQYSALFSVPVIGGAVGRMLSVRHLALCDGSDVTEGMLLW